MNKTLKRYGPAVLTTAALLAATPSMVATAAATSTQLGATFDPSACVADVTGLQTSTPAGVAYTVPADGVITSWRYQASANAQGAVGFRLGRALTSGDYEIVAAGPNVVPNPSQALEQKVRIPAKAGDLLGLYTATGECARLDQAYGAVFATGDITSGPLGSIAAPPAQVDVAATLEPDADRDGYGDVTQDQCPTEAATAGPCTPAPVTAPTTFTFTKAPTAKGDAKVGSRLRVGSSVRRYVSPKPGTLKISWYANGAKIKGANHRTYVVGAQDVGKKIKAKVTVSGGAPTKTYTVTFKGKAKA